MERMSAAQSRIFVLGNLMKDPTAYSLMIRYDTVSELDIHRLRDALTTTMQHHDSLQTCFFARSQDNQPMQGLLLFPVRRFKHVPYATDHDIEQELQASRDKVWDIEHGETLSLTVLSQSSKKHTLILGYHHIIFDASSMRRFKRDLSSAYNMRPLKRDFGTCIEYARQEHQDKESNMLESNMQYWRKEFSIQDEVLPLLPLSNNTMRPDSRHVSSSHAECMIDEETVKATKQVCQELGITPF